MTNLTPTEKQDLHNVIIPAINRAAPNSIIILPDLFRALGRSYSPRLSRYLFERVVAGLIPQLQLVGSRACEGFRKTE